MKEERLPEKVNANTRPIREYIFNQAEINADLGTFSWNLDTDELYYSDNFYRLLGCEPNEFIPDINYFNETFLHPEDRQKIEEARRNIKMNKYGDTWEYRIRTKNGLTKNIKAISNVAVIEGQRILVGTLQDVTKEVAKLNQLKRRQEELRLANIELKTSLRVIHFAEISAGLGHWHINLATSEFKLSDNLCKICGFDIKEETTFESVLSMVHPDDRQNLVESSLKDYKMNRTSVSVFRIIRRDGKSRYVKGTSDKIRINKTNFIVGIAQDITSLIDKEIMLEEKNLQLERQNAELASFNHMASHDLQEPLRKIQVLSKLIIDKEESSLSSTSINYFNRIVHSAHRMQNLINDLLDYSRTNNPTTIKIPYDLNKILHESLINLKEEINTRKASIKAGTLPVLNVIPSQIQQLFINLLDNAIKYSKEAVPPEINITVKIVPGEFITGFGLKKIAQYHCISISDNGIGFDQQYSQKIFEIFQRLHGKNEYSGTGIGLTICKKVVQNHNGYITATGVPGEGATFNLFFPVEDNLEQEFM